jgi:hypothetical protein
MEDSQVQAIIQQLPEHSGNPSLPLQQAISGPDLFQNSEILFTQIWSSYQIRIPSLNATMYLKYSMRKTRGQIFYGTMDLPKGPGLSQSLERIGYAQLMDVIL